MSTKTTLKRVALVAVSALGFGVLSVAPSSATSGDVTPTSVVIGTIPTAAVGVSTVVPITVVAPYTVGGSDSFNINVRVTSAPTGSAFAGLATASKLADGTNVGTFVAATYASGSTVGAQLTISKPSTNTGTLGTSALDATDKVTVGATYASPAGLTVSTTNSYSFRVNITPDKAGTYTVLVSTKAGATTGAYAAGDANASFSFSTAAATSSVTLAAVTGTSLEDVTYGQIFKATIKDSTGTVSQLGSGETIALTSNQASLTMGKARTDGEQTAYNQGAAATTLTLSSADFKNGVAYFYALNSDAETAVVTATGAGLLSTSVTNTISVVTRTQSSTAATPTISDPTSATRPGSGHVGFASDADTASTAATSHSYKATFSTAGTVSTYVQMSVTDTSGKITGLTSGRYDEALTLDATDGTVAAFTITGTLSTAGQSFTAVVYGASDSTSDTVVVTSAAAEATTLTSDHGTAAISQSHGTSTVINAILKDQFGAAMANQAITVSTTGRNASSSSTALSTDSAGRIVYTRTDAGTSATLNKQDTVTFTGPNSSVSTDDLTVTINYGTVTASTITCLTGNEDDTSVLATYRDISAGDGVQGGAASLCTVTVKDANGSVMVGVPVTTTTTSEGAAVRSTSATLYTGTAGTVAPSVYGWTAGTKTFTITAGGVTKTVTVNYQQRTPAEVRTISASLSGNVITVTAKDRLGNLVPGVRVYATRTGDATFGGGSTVANAITAGNTTGTTPVPADLGTAQIVVNPGTSASTVKIQLASAADTPDAEYGQSSSTAGKICDGAGCTDTALTAATTGTAFTGEVGVGASLSPAGVNSVTVAVAAGVNAAQVAADAATDAALEAIDAANAATDAANLAAEAADAATVAAEEARDAADAATAAVEALASEVATLIAGLKAQITTLANTVAKIAKKVKA